MSGENFKQSIQGRLTGHKLLSSRTSSRPPGGCNQMRNSEIITLLYLDLHRHPLHCFALNLQDFWFKNALQTQIGLRRTLSYLLKLHSTLFLESEWHCWEFFEFLVVLQKPDCSWIKSGWVAQAKPCKWNKNWRKLINKLATRDAMIRVLCLIIMFKCTSSSRREG